MPGSGGHWSDGIVYSDWSLHGGSNLFRQGLALKALGAPITYQSGGWVAASHDIKLDVRDGDLGYWERLATTGNTHRGVQKIRNNHFAIVGDVQVVERWVQLAQQGPEIEWWSARADNNVDYFGRKVTYEKGESTVIDKTVVILTYHSTGNKLKSVTGIRVVTTVTADGEIAHKASTLPVVNGKTAVPVEMQGYIESLTNFWRSKTVMDKYWDFVLSPQEKPKITSKYGTSTER